MILGPPGSLVTLTFSRGNLPEPVRVELRRAWAPAQVSVCCVASLVSVQVLIKAARHLLQDRGLRDRQLYEARPREA